MEWILVPAILIAIFTILCILLAATGNGVLGGFAVLLGLVSFIMCIGAPASYYSGLQDSIEWTSYYNNMIEPNMVTEEDNTIVISNSNAATWQIANRMNINSYNSYLASNRYWDNIPIIGWMVYSAPPTLKYVQISK